MPGELRSLTGLRGVAACAVMVGHFTEDSVRSGLVGRLLDQTYHAVDLFFVLSGFVLAMVYGQASADRGKVTLPRFLQHRIARLYPLYMITTLVSFWLARADFSIYGDPNSSLPALVSNLAMTQFWGWPSDSLNGPGWSISTEWAANLLFPALTFLCLRCSWLVSASVVILALIVGVVADHFATDTFWGTAIVLHWNRLRLPEPLIGCTVEFMAGIFCWRLRTHARWAAMLGRSSTLWLVLAFTTLIYLVGSAKLVLVLSICLLVIGLSFERAKLALLLGSPILHRLGRLSYSIYLVHVPMITLARGSTTIFNDAGLAHAHSVAVVLAMAATLVVADLSYRLIERPSQKLLRSGFDRLSGYATSRANVAISD